MTEHDARYYRDRLSAERTRALEAMTPEASAIHRTLAELYRQRLEESPVPNHRRKSARNAV